MTRNSDLTIQETEVKSSLLSTIQETLRQRKWGAAVRLEIADRADDGFLAQLQTAPRSTSTTATSTRSPARSTSPRWPRSARSRGSAS